MQCDHRLVCMKDTSGCLTLTNWQLLNISCSWTTVLPFKGETEHGGRDKAWQTKVLSLLKVIPTQAGTLDSPQEPKGAVSTGGAIASHTCLKLNKVCSHISCVFDIQCAPINIGNKSKQDTNTDTAAVHQFRRQILWSQPETVLLFQMRWSSLRDPNYLFIKFLINFQFNKSSRSTELGCVQPVSRALQCLVGGCFEVQLKWDRFFTPFYSSHFDSS